MFRSLYARLAAALALLLVAIGLIYTVFTLYSTRVFLQEIDQRFNRDLARELLVQRDMLGVEGLDEESVKDLFGYYMHINPAIEIYLLDAEGRILAFEAPQMRIRRERVSLAPIRAFLAGDALPILGDDPRSPDRRKIFSAAAIPPDGVPRQYLYVVLGGEAYDSVRELLRDSWFAKLSAAGALVVVLFGLLAGTLAFNLLTRRLRRLAASMDGFRSGGFREYRPYGGSGEGDEIDRLGADFDAMARRIAEQVEALEQKDTLRRNLVANVSHDLRTPLAALQGYIETLLLKSGEFNTEERRRHLRTAFEQSERLTRLVGELFELSRLEAREHAPAKEPVAVGELVHDVVQKFRITGEDHGIGFDTAIDRDLPMVEADIAMLDRVMDNLLANAIEHTPESGRIRVAAERAAGGVEVTVANTGEGVSPQQIPHLFDRFYQAPERRGKGAGLGLAIVRRILELHDSVPEAFVTPEGETAFRFRLPAVEGEGTQPNV